MLNTVESRWGPCTYFLKDEYVGRSIHYYGEYNPDETEKILELADPNKLCLDIGANIGCISMALANAGHEVVAFEPQPEVFKLLQRNHRGKNVHSAVGNANGLVDMPKVYYGAKGNFGGLGINTPSIYGSYKVPIHTLDSYEFKNVGFIKIDVEGFETSVLMSGVETIRRDKPIMYIEDDRISERTKLRNMVAALGYTYEMHQPLLYREENFKGYKKNVWDRNYASHNLICRPI